MDRQGSGSEGSRLHDSCSLPHGRFQTSTERARLRAAVYQVFGRQPWGGCCSDKLLEALLEGGERCYLKQQLFWDFQLLDSDHDGYLSAQDAELLLAQVPRVTGEACGDFLRSRQPGVAWSDIEDWVFGAPRMPVDRAGPRTRRAYFGEQAPRVQVSTPPYRWGIRRGDEQQLEGGDPRGLAVLQEDKPSGVVAALERKYQVLQRKLCAEMLEAHYGQSLWASLPCNVKEEKISELEMLVDFALREGSILSLSSLPGAQHSVRSGAQAAQGGLAVGPLDPSVTEGTTAHALQQLQRKKRAEMAEMGTQRHLLVGSNPEISSRRLLLHTQAELVQQETSFQAALLALELFTGERFWESGPTTPEDCHRELARLRLTAGHGSEPAWRESKTMPGRSMTQVLLDRLLLQQEKDRTSLVQILLTLGKKEEGVHEQVHSREQLSYQEAETRMAGVSPPLEEVVSQVLNLAQKQLRVAHGAKVSWQDCAIAVLVKVQREQLEELRHALEDLAGVSSGREGETCPGLYEKLLSRLQEPPLMSLVQRLRPPSPQQQWVQETLQVDQTAHPACKSLQSDPEAITAEERLWKEEILGSLQKGKESEDKGLIQMTSADFSAQGELEPKWEGPGHHPLKGPKGPDPQQIMNHNAELFKVEGTTQTGTDGPQTQTQLLKKSVQPQEFPEPFQVPDKFQQDLQNVREVPYSQEGSQEQIESLVPHHSQKQQETGMKFSRAQRGGIQTESEIFDFQEEESAVPCGIPGFSEVKDPKAATGGEFGGLQDSSQQQEASQGAVVMGHAIPGYQGLLLRKSKSLASLESSAIQTLPPQGLQGPEIPLQTKLQASHLLAAQQKEMGVLDTQGSSEAQIEMAIIRVDEMREGTDTKPQPSPKGKQKSPMIQRKVNSEVFVLHDEGSHKTLHTQGTPVPLPEEWRDSGVEQKTLKAYKDLHEESLTLQGPGTRYSKDPCHKEQNIPEPSQLLGALLKNSKSLEPQELTRTYEYVVPPEIQQEHIYPHVPHSQEWKGAKAQKEMKTPKDHNLREGLQYQTFPESEPEIVQTPELLQKELEASKLKQKLQAIEVSSKETQVPSPEAQRTEVHQASMETDSLCAQDKVQRNLVRTQAIQTHNQEETEVFLTNIALARKAKSLDPEDMAQRQVVSQLGKLPTTEMPERRSPQDHLQKEVDVPQAERRLMEKLDVPDAPESCLQPRISGREQEVFERVQAQKQMGPETFQGYESEFLQRDQGTLVFQGSPQDHHHPEEESPKATLSQKGTEFPQPQNLPFCGILWRKSKSLELRKPPSFHLQELREPEGPSVQSQHPQTDREVLVSQECRKSGDFLSQGQETKTQDPQAEEFPLKEKKALQVQQTAQNESKFTGPQNVKEIISFSSEERRQTEIHSLQETQLEKPTSPDLRESPLALQCHERTSLEILDVQQATPQKHAAIPQIIRDAETLPLLWNVLGQKAKSFELGKTSVLPSPELELTLAQEMPQKEVCVPQPPQGVKGVSMIQLLGQSPVEPETQKSQVIREAKILYHQGLKEPDVPQTQAEEALSLETEYQSMKTSRISPELLLEQSNIVTPGKIKALQPQDMKGLGGTSIQKDPQRRSQMLHRQESPQTKVGLPKYSSTFRETKELHLLERKGSENVDTQVNVQPKMWLPQPQGTRSPESPPLLWGSLGLKSKSFEFRKPHALETQELKESLIVQSQRSQRELGAQKTSECQQGTVISLQELKEAEVTLVQAEKETLKTEVMPYTCPEILQPQCLQLHGNECQAIPQVQGNDSPSKVVLPHEESGGPDTSPPLLWTSLETKAKSFELRKPQTFQTQDLRVLESTIFPQRISQLSGSQEERGPQASQTQHGLIENSEVEQGLHLQEPRGLESLKVQRDPQRSQTTSQSYSVQQQGLKEPQAFQSHGGSHSGALQSQPAPERERRFLHHQKRNSPETPPLLWWALELAQQGMQHMELLVSPQPQEFIESPETNLQEKQKEESKSQKSKEHMDPMNLCSQELEAPVIEEDIFQDERMIPTVDLLQSQERRGPKFQQAEDIPPEVESQATGRAELTQSPTESPQAFEARAPKKMENALLERSPQTEQDTKETQGSSGEQKTFVPEETMGLESSQDNKPQMCYFYKASETEGFLPSGGLVRKSKSLDLMKLCVPKPQELSELESPQVQKEPAHRTKDFSVTSKDLEMKPQKKKGPPSFKSEGKSGLESVKAQEPETESHAALSPPPSQNVLELKSESLLVVEPSTWQSQEQQEGIVIQPQGSPQMDPENIKLQGSMDLKTVCSQGHCEAGSCELKMEEDNHTEAKGILQSHPHTFLVREASWPQVALLRKSKSLELQKLSVPETFLPQELKKSETLQAPEGTQGCPAVAENQVVENWGKCSSHQKATQIVKSSLQNWGVLKNGAEFPAQKEMSFQMTSTPQKQLGENEPSALDSQEDMHSEVEQVPGQKGRDILQPLGAPQVEQIPLQAMEGLQKNSESFVSLESTDSRYLFPLQVEETPLKVPKTLELMKSPTQVPSASMESKPFLPSWILRRSKSLDLRELEALQPLSLVGDLDSPNWQNLSRLTVSQSQRKLQDELSEPQKIKGPVVLHSKALPVQEHFQKDQMGPQLQEERICEVQKPEQMRLQPAQNREQMGNNGEVLCSQALEDTQVFYSKECADVKALSLQGCPLSAKEPLQIQRCLQMEPELHGLLEPQLLLDPKEERDLQGSPLMSNLLRKSKTLGLELLRRSDVSQVQHLPRPESPQSQVTLEPGTQLLQLQGSVEQVSCSIQGISKMDVHQHQEIQNTVEETLEFPENLDSRGIVLKVEVDPMKAKKSLQVNQELFQEQGSSPLATPQSSMLQMLPPHELPQFGINLLQELGRLHNELESLRPQELKHEEDLHPQETQVLSEPEGHGAAKALGSVGLPILQHQIRKGTESRQPLPTDQRVSEEHETQLGRQAALPSPQKMQEFCQTLGAMKKESETSTDLPAPKVSEIGLPETSPVISNVMMSPHVLQSQKHVEPKSHCLQETPQIGWESLEDTEKTLEKRTRPIKSQEELVGALLVKSQTLEHQELPRMNQEMPCKVLSGVEDLPFQDIELGLQQMISPKESLHRQSQGLGSQEQKTRDSVLLLPLTQRGPKAQQVDEHFQGEQETSPFPKSRHIRFFQQGVQTEMGTSEPQQLEERPASHEWKEEGIWSIEGAQQSALSAPLDPNYLESGAAKGRLGVSSPWRQREEVLKTWKPAVVPMLSPPSLGKCDEELRWEPASPKVGLSREPSMSMAQAENAAGPARPQQPLKEEAQRDGEGITETINVDSKEARTCQPPPPRPPCREKAFIWFSREEKEEALQRLAAIQAEGERRRQQDKERQILRFEERLSIAKHRKLEEDLLGRSPTERWPLPPAHLCQDQGGQKTAVKRHLEKVKRERTYVMQSKRERNTLRFKELLNPLVTHSEESPEPGQIGDA